MNITDVPWGDIVQGGCGTVALYLALQIRKMVMGIERRVERLEEAETRRRRRKAPRR